MIVIPLIVKIDSITGSFCLCYYVQNGLSYSGEETQLTLCIYDAKPRSGVKDLKQNKHQLLHRITSVKTPLLYKLSSQKRKKTVTSSVSFCAFGICTCKAAKIDTWAQFHQRSMYSFYVCRSQTRKKRQSSQQCHLALLGPTSVT